MISQIRPRDRRPLPLRKSWEVGEFEVDRRRANRKRIQESIKSDKHGKQLQANRAKL